jgi:hypothetical protein
MRKKRKLTITGRHFEEKQPLATRPFIIPPSNPVPGRMPFLRLHKTGPTEKMDMSGAELAESFGPSVTPDAIFFLDTCIFSSCESKPLWDLFRSRQILISQMVSTELHPWIKEPHRNQEIRNWVYESVKSQFALGEDAASANPSPESASVLRNLGIQIRFPNERYQQHGYEYYFKLLALRKFMGPIIAESMKQRLGRPPSRDEFAGETQRFVRERGLVLANKGIEGMNSPNLLTDEQTVVTAVLTAILEGREVYIVTTDHDIPEQFHKLYLLIKEHYRAMLAAELYAMHPDRMAFREVSVSGNLVESNPWEGTSILELRLPEIRFDVLPHEFRSTVVHCIWLDPDEKRPKFSYSCFTMDTEAARVLRVKAATGGLTTDRFGGRNCTIRTRPLTPEQHEVVVSIGKEKVFRYEGWGDFGADDWLNTLACCEEVTRLRPIEPICAEAVPSGTLMSPLGDREVVKDYLVKYRKLLDQIRAYILGQMALLTKLTDLASWRRAQVDGTLRKLKRLCDLRDALMTNSETITLIRSVGIVSNCLKSLTLEPTQDDVRQRAAWERSSELTLQLGKPGPQDDGQVAVWQKASLDFLDASLTAYSTKQRLLEDAVKKWLADEAGSVAGGAVDEQVRTL